MSVNTIKQYGSIGEFLTVMESGRYASHDRQDMSWTGARSIGHACQIVRDGYQKYLPMIDGLVAKTTESAPVTSGTVWEPAVAGPFPIVPAAIAGLPDSMMAREVDMAANNPLRIFVSICMSGGASDEVTAKRGAAILALLQVLAKVRPVECWIFGDMGSSGYICTPMVKLDTLPIDMATASAALTNQCVSRALFFPWARTEANWPGQWAWNSIPGTASATKLTREAIGATEQDLVICGGCLHEADQMIRHPEVWVADQVKKTLALTETQE